MLLFNLVHCFCALTRIKHLAVALVMPQYCVCVS